MDKNDADIAELKKYYSVRKLEDGNMDAMFRIILDLQKDMEAVKAGEYD